MTKIAENEIVSANISQRLFKIRDGLICAPNIEKLSLQNGSVEEIDEEIACQFLTLLSDNSLVSDEIQCDLLEVVRHIKGKTFTDCEQMIHPLKCCGCPCYKGGL